MTPFYPMLVGRAQSPPPPSDWSYEVKYDGWRSIVEVARGGLRMWSRNGHDLTRRFPELESLRGMLPPCVIDAELVVLDEEGRPRFEWMHRKTRPAATLVAFDVLCVGRRSVLHVPLEQRRAALESLIPADLPTLLRSRVFTDGAALLEQCETHKLEGVVAKRSRSKYRPGVRTDDWLKIRTLHGAELIKKRLQNAHA